MDGPSQRLPFLARFCVLAPLAAMLGCGSDDGKGQDRAPADAAPSDDAPVRALDGATTALSGTVVDFATLRPLAERTVWIGPRSTTTDARGAFAFARVAVPYDVTVVDPDGSSISIYRALTLRNPILPHAHVPEVASNTATLNGDVSGGGEYPLTGTDAVGIYFLSDIADDESSISGLLPSSMSGPGYGPMYLNWDGADSLSGRLVALGAFSSGTDGGLSAWFVNEPVTLKRGESAFVDLALAALPSMKHVSGSIVTPPDATIVEKQAFYKLPTGNSAISVPVQQDSTPTLEADVPEVGKLGGQWCVGADAATDAPSGSSLTQRCGVTPGDDGLMLILQESPSISTVTQQMTLTEDAPLAWSGFDNGIYLLELRSAVPSKRSPNVSVYTPDRSLTWPDLTTIGVAFPNTASYDLSVAGLGPYASPDEAFGEHGMADPFPVELRRSYSSTLYVTTGP